MRYRCNTIARLRTTALDAGFRGAEFRVLEQAGMFETYFPPWLAMGAPGVLPARSTSGPSPALFGTLLFRLVA